MTNEEIKAVWILVINICILAGNISLLVTVLQLHKQVKKLRQDLDEQNDMIRSRKA